MIDTHTHLYLEEFKDDIDDVISRAKNVGVHKFYLPSISSKYNNSMHDLEKKFPDDISCMIGLHPCYVDDNFHSEINFICHNENRINIKKGTSSPIEYDLRYQPDISLFRQLYYSNLITKRLVHKVGKLANNIKKSITYG